MIKATADEDDDKAGRGRVTRTKAERGRETIRQVSRWRGSREDSAGNGGFR